MVVKARSWWAVVVAGGAWEARLVMVSSARAYRRLRGGVRGGGGAHGGAISSSGRVWVPYFRPLGHVADPWGWLTSTKQFLQSSCAEEMLTGANRVKIDVVTTDATTVDYPVN